MSTSPNAIRFASYIVAVQDLEKACAFYCALGAELDRTTELVQPTPISALLQELYDIPAGTKFRIAKLRIPGSDIVMRLAEFTDLDRGSSYPRFYDPGAVQLILDLREIGPALEAAREFGVKVITVGDAPVQIGFPGDPAPTEAIVVEDFDGHYVEFVRVNPEHVANKFGETPGPAKLTQDLGVNIVFPSFRSVPKDLGDTVAFYREEFGLEIAASPWARDESLMRMSGLTTDGESRVGEMRVPGTPPMHGWTFFETTAEDATPYELRLTDVGGYAIGLEVLDLPAAVSAITKAGGSVITTGAGWVSTPAGDTMALVRDTNGLLLELVQYAGAEG
ncbi:VOC family protein [Nonomuraea sp. NPDC059023]|uniref:VOC family protein n=1 Tax=unclassified Nonomuraea TaxID=2593643 RepID=UPI0036C5900F